MRKTTILILIIMLAAYVQGVAFAAAEHELKAKLKHQRDVGPPNSVWKCESSETHRNNWDATAKKCSQDP